MKTDETDGGFGLQALERWTGRGALEGESISGRVLQQQWQVVSMIGIQIGFVSVLESKKVLVLTQDLWQYREQRRDHDDCTWIQG